MDYFLALFTMFLVFVVPVVILVALIGKPVSKGKRPLPGEIEEDGARRTLPGGSAH